MATILSLRPQGSNTSLGERLRAWGHHLVEAPLLQIEPTSTPPPEAHADCAAAIITSANAVEALRMLGWSKPVHAVGRETAAAAIRAGLSTDQSPPAGDARGLAQTVARQTPKGSALLYARGETIAFPMAATLARAELRCIEWIVYGTVLRAGSEPELVAAREMLEAHAIDAVLLTSPALARAFARWASPWAATPHLLAMSPRIAAALPDHLRARVSVAAEPNMEALLSLLGTAPTGS